MAKVDLLAHTPHPEVLIEVAGRTAYQSTGLITEDSAGRFVRMLIKRGHVSVLEHASATFRITGASRSFTHQIVRHRLCSFTQQSQRYVDETAFDFVTPMSVDLDGEALAVYDEHMKRTADTYRRLAELGIPREDARFVLPNAIESEIVVTANFRQWRHVIDLRGEGHAQWEIRGVAVDLLRQLQGIAPNCFGDYVVEGDEIRSEFRE